MEKLDVLHREEFVSQLLNLVNNISMNKSSTCFAINGAWGCGKSFVLDLFQEQLEQVQSEETSADKYFVIRYNCWKFDYYEEPLVAIVSTIMSSIEEKTKLFPDNEKKSKMLGMLKAAGVSLLSVGADAVKAKTGLDFQQAYETLRAGKDEGLCGYEEEHKYDVYFNFNKVLQELSDLLKGLAEDFTVVFLVDELDRCLPEYSVKILERLHHLTENQSNIITIVSMDKKQLSSNIKQIFGFENPEKYLEKFIQFEIKLDYGTVSETIVEKYADYIALFDKEIFPFEDSYEECLQAIFKGIDIRTQEQLMKKVIIAHQLLYPEKKDYSFMCMEVLLAVMICVYHDNSCLSESPLKSRSFDEIFIPTYASSRPAFSTFFKDEFEQIRFSINRSFSDEPIIYLLPKEPSLYAAIFFTWYWMHKKSYEFIVRYTTGTIYEKISGNYTELSKFAEMIHMMS